MDCDTTRPCLVFRLDIKADAKHLLKRGIICIGEKKNLIFVIEKNASVYYFQNQEIPPHLLPAFQVAQFSDFDTI